MSFLLSDLPPDERLSDSLRRLLAEAGGKPMAIRQMIEILHGRGIQIVVVLLCLPFLSPVSIPGISIPFGLAIALTGLRLAFGHRPWLPGLILDRHVSYHVLEKMITFACRIYDRVEKVIRPRLGIFLEAPGMTIVIGLAIAIAGILLSLPIPPPFPLTNTIPGFAIIFLSLGIMERDGLLVLLGYVLTIVATAYVALIAVLGTEGALRIWRFFTGG